ncbi:cytochrome P450 [Saccharopolyspora gloriosae]|uniref:cytochrome P450 n=1 Tax=Saccharopolyspora gloriosae TaxID=455344 RepID=UPI001FB7EB79|nr:cytochrome P450 [Saccharopolyspora gloriosae]
MTSAQPVEHPTTRSDPFDPHDGLSELRADRPLARMHHPDGALGWLVTGYDLVRELLLDQRFSSRIDLLRGPAEQNRQEVEAPPGLFSVLGPPEHTWYRRKLSSAFAHRRMRQLEPVVEEIVTARLDAMAEKGGPVDLVETFASPIAFQVIRDLLGVDLDRASVRATTEALLMLDVDPEEAGQAWSRLWEELHERVRGKRTDPGEDLVSALIADAELSDEEITTMSAMLITGGDDTTANMLALATYALLAHPAELAALRENPSAITTAVEELLRYLTINQYGTTRTALEDVEFHGETIRQGELVTLSLSAANRDPGQFPDPDQLNLLRPANGHLAFGHGIHHCLGAQLARIELRAGLSGLLERFPGLRLAVPAQEIPLRSAAVNYGVHHLPVDW